MSKSVFCLFYMLCISQLSAATTIPTGLLTDLVEHTDRLYKNGYLLNQALWQKESLNSLQFVEIGSTRPSFSWIVPSEQPGTIQTGYQLIVSSTYQGALKEEGSVWDSGKVDCSESTAIAYKGADLVPATTYFWRVKTITNTAGESEYSEIKAFRTAAVLTEYTTPHYPLVKTMEYPIQVQSVAPAVYAVDFGKSSFAQIQLTLSAKERGDTVHIHLGERLSGNRINRNPGGTIRYQCYPLTLVKGTHTYKIEIAKDKRNTGNAAILMPDYIGEVLPFRYCEVEGYNDSLTPMQLLRETVHYPFDESSASFRCNNDTLNQLWDLCKYSIKATSFAGIYVDGDRERIPYEADALINQLCHYGVDREFSMARRSHEYLLQHPTWPTEWIMQAVLIAWNDYVYTGDQRSLQANYDLLKARTLRALKEKNNLISTTTGTLQNAFAASIHFNGKIKDIVDWPHTGILGLNKQEGGEADGFVFTDYNVVTNAYHYEAVKRMASIAALLNKKEEALLFTTEARNFKTLFNKTFWNKAKQCYVDGIGTEHASLHANMFPLAFGLVSPENRASVLQFIQSRGMACSVYGSQFLMDALYNANDAEYALSLLTKTDDRSWYNMIRVGSTISLEAWDDKYKPNQDWNHAWGAAPANIISRKLMGVEPLTPAFGIVRVKPQLASLRWAKATIPSIKGSINIAVENNIETDKTYQLKLVVPANMEAEIYLPYAGGNYKVSKNNIAVKANKVKGEPFLYLGKVPSGTYVFKMIIGNAGRSK